MAAGSRYSDQQRREAVMLYVLHGNWRRVSELTHIPERTLNDWSTQSWFATMLAELRAEKGAEFDGALTRVLDEATKQLLDRLQHGDPYIVGGEVKRRPVAAKDLAIIAGVAFDKRQLYRNLPEAAPGPKVDSLRELAEYCAFVAAQKKMQREGSSKPDSRD
jgi:hypothetical protein